MTGIEALRKEMALRGCSKVQIESKTLYIVLDILSQETEKYITIYEDEKRAKKLLDEAIREKQNVSRLMQDNKKLIDQAEKVMKEIKSYIDDFYKALENCETDEGRDRLRLAQMYINSVTVNTVYDNTAFIASLAALLSGAKVDPLKELKKINPDIGITVNGKSIKTPRR